MSVVKGMCKTHGLHSEGDNSVRVIRLPNTKHLKTFEDPFKIKLIHFSDSDPYDFGKFLEKYGHKEEKKQPSQEAQKPQKTKDKSGTKDKVIQELLTKPLDQIIQDAASEVGITIEFKHNSDGSRQIIENGEITSGFISKLGEYCYSASGKDRRGNQIKVVEYYKGCSRGESIKWLKEKYDIQEEEEEEEEKKKKPTQAEILVNIIQKDENIELFHTEVDEPFARVFIEDHYENLKITSRTFKDMLSYRMYTDTGKVPNAESVSNALSVVKAECRYKGQKIELHNRIAWYNGEIYYDMADDKWRAIKITPSKRGQWSIENNPPILFKRYTHQQEQVEPDKDGDFDLIFKYIRLKNKDQKILFLVSLLSFFIPDFPHVIIYFYGSKGATKTTQSKASLKIIDPSNIEAINFSKSEAEFSQRLNHHYTLLFDNISGIPRWVSDLLCRAVSGGGFVKRELFTDDEDIIMKFRRCIIMNGINMVVSRPDLLDRTILFELDRITEEERMTEGEFWRNFDEDLPKILGGVFTAVSKALKAKETIKLKKHTRMADFCEWGCAIAEAIEYEQEEFLNAYFKNTDNQNREILFSDMIATCVFDLLKDKEDWEGTPSELLSEFKKIAVEKNIDIKDRDFPKSAARLSRHLGEIKANLEDEGIDFQRARGNERRIRLKRNTKFTDDIDDTEKIPTILSTVVKTIPKATFDDTNDTDATFHSLTEKKNTEEIDTVFSKEFPVSK